MEMDSKFLQGKSKQLKDVTMAISIKMALIVFVLFLAGQDDKLSHLKKQSESKTSQENTNKIRR